MIGIINGSPKGEKSNSALLIGHIVSEIGGRCETEVIKAESIGGKLKKYDVLIFVFPLYVDGIPSHLLKKLDEFCRTEQIKKGAFVYCVINNGFFEGKQNHSAVRQMKNWCLRAGGVWGQGVGVGGGEMLTFLTDIPLGHGPNKDFGNALMRLADNAVNGRAEADIYASPNWFRFLWRIEATFSVWLPRAKMNGVKLRELFRKI